MKLSDIITGYTKRTVVFPKLTLIFEEGKPPTGIYVVLRGRVSIKTTCQAGTFTIAALEPGDLIGELSTFDIFTEVCTATAVAETDVELAQLDREQILSEYLKLPQLQQDIFAGLARRLCLTTAHAVMEMSRQETARRGEAGK